MAGQISSNTTKGIEKHLFVAQISLPLQYYNTGVDYKIKYKLDKDMYDHEMTYMILYFEKYQFEILKPL